MRVSCSKGYVNWYRMKLLIDLPDDVALDYNVIAAKNGTDRKNYIQDLLVLHARGGFKAKKPSTKRTSK